MLKVFPHPIPKTRNYKYSFLCLPDLPLEILCFWDWSLEIIMLFKFRINTWLTMSFQKSFKFFVFSLQPLNINLGTSRILASFKINISYLKWRTPEKENDFVIEKLLAHSLVQTIFIDSPSPSSNAAYSFKTLTVYSFVQAMCWEHS